MKTPTLIGLIGPAGSGKDTVRRMLEDLNFTGLAFADPIRQMLRELLLSNGIDDAYIDDRDLKEAPIPQLGVSYRQLAQTLGTEWGRSLLHKDFWLRLAAAYMQSLMQEGLASRFVISDVRFENEAAWIREHGGQIWRIERPGLAPVRVHASETGIRDIAVDLVIDNGGDLVQLADRVQDALGALA